MQCFLNLVPSDKSDKREFRKTPNENSYTRLGLNMLPEISMMH